MKGEGDLNVVDTNVAAVANNRSTMSARCALECIRALDHLMAHGRLALDEGWLILSEYKDNLSASGQPGVGDAFLKWVLRNHANPARCARVRITPRRDDPSSFEQFPDHQGLAAFDPDDRKFVAVAAAHPERPPILEASDSKWWGWKNALDECGIRVAFLCPDEVARVYREKMGGS
jgi:hypothetical protein